MSLSSRNWFCGLPVFDSHLFGKRGQKKLRVIPSGQFGCGHEQSRHRYECRGWATSAEVQTFLFLFTDCPCCPFRCLLFVPFTVSCLSSLSLFLSTLSLFVPAVHFLVHCVSPLSLLLSIVCHRYPFFCPPFVSTVSLLVACLSPLSIFW